MGCGSVNQNNGAARCVREEATLNKEEFGAFIEANRTRWLAQVQLRRPYVHPDDIEEGLARAIIAMCQPIAQPKYLALMAEKGAFTFIRTRVEWCLPGTAKRRPVMRGCPLEGLAEMAVWDGEEWVVQRGHMSRLRADDSSYSDRSPIVASPVSRALNGGDRGGHGTGRPVARQVLIPCRDRGRRTSRLLAGGPSIGDPR